jgi:transglutaminase-like putative cysteine protease
MLGARRSVSILFLLACASAGTLQAAPVGLTPMFFIPTETRTEAPVPSGAPLRLELETRDPARLARILGAAAHPSGTTLVDYVISGPPVPPMSPTGPNWLESTFVIDHDDAGVLRLRDEFRAQTKGLPSAAAVAHFVAAKMDASSDQGWELASTVARRRRGDCTEHAVLTTALARSLGLPARVAIGFALIATDGQYGAFGHAWSEVLENGRWVVADAAIDVPDLDVRYVPLLWMQDESPAYNMQFLDPLSSWVQRVVVLGPGPVSTLESRP